MLQNLCKNGYLLSENKSRWTTYHLNYEDNVDSTIINVDSPASNMDSSINTNVTPANVNVREVDGVSMDSSTANMDSSDDSNVDSSNGKQTRFKFEEIESKIIGICLLKYKSVAQIAEELNKSKKYLKIKNMVKSISKKPTRLSWLFVY